MSFWSLEEESNGEKYIQICLEKQEDYFEWEHLFEHELPPPADEEVTKKVGILLGTIKLLFLNLEIKLGVFGPFHWQ